MLAFVGPACFHPPRSEVGAGRQYSPTNASNRVLVEQGIIGISEYRCATLLGLFFHSLYYFRQQVFRMCCTVNLVRQVLRRFQR